MDAPLLGHPVLSIVCTMHNEAESLDAFFAKLLPVFAALGEEFEIVCVNDGSLDATLGKLVTTRQREPRIRMCDLSQLRKRPINHRLFSEA